MIVGATCDDKSKTDRWCVVDKERIEKNIKYIETKERIRKMMPFRQFRTWALSHKNPCEIFANLNNSNPSRSPVGNILVTVGNERITMKTLYRRYLHLEASKPN